MSLIKGAIQSGHKGCAYTRDCPEKIRQNLECASLEIFDKPQDLEGLFNSTKVVIHHGGLGTTENCLMAGKPQLFAPRHKEQILNVQAVLSQGCGVSMRSNAKFNSSHAEAALNALLSDQQFIDNASKISEQLKGIPGSTNQIVEACKMALSQQR